jgi:hypothetical protein
MSSIRCLLVSLICVASVSAAQQSSQPKVANKVISATVVNVDSRTGIVHVRLKGNGQTRRIEQSSRGQQLKIGEVVKVKALVDASGKIQKVLAVVQEHSTGPSPSPSPSPSPECVKAGGSCAIDDECCSKKCMGLPGPGHCSI